MKQTLTIEQSARLIELGVDERKASSIYYTTDPCDHKKCIRKYQFCLTDLFRILPKKVSDRRKIYSLTIEIADCLDGDDKWCISYRNTLDMDEWDSFQSAEELIDAIYAMILFLKSEKELVWL